jgi:CHAD domain-containing protein
VEHKPVTPDLPIVEAGRRLMADELTIIQAHWSELRQSSAMVAVHETRKAIRRTFTLFKLFAPYFAPGELERHRAGLRKMMRRLAPCRDTAVFRLKLAAYNESASNPLWALEAAMAERQAGVDRKLGEFLGRASTYQTLNQYATLLATEGVGLPEPSLKSAPLLVRHELPSLIFRLLGAVRAYGDILDTATSVQFHQLRIQFKELRYTLTFFQGLLDGSGASIIEVSSRVQDHLGDLNDTAVALSLLKEMTCCPTEAAIYAGFQKAEMARLTAEFPPLYHEFDQADVRRQLAVVLAGM